MPLGLPFNPVNETLAPDGTRYVETSNQWKQLCQALPSFKEVAWPDYATAVIEDRINGHDVVIQPWKGWCQQFLMREDFPGGVGAEVGIYRRQPERTLPDVLPDVPATLVARYAAKAAGLIDADQWW